MAESLTLKWLRQNIQSYAHADVVYAHVDSVLVRYPSIRPKTDVYTYDDGRTQLLLCLHGLLPISYRGASYNFPIAVWITKDYPRQPPIAYVVPTSDMLVRKSRHVDVSGRCEIDYIGNWARKSEGCNIIALLEAMQDHFSREPPVYAKPQTATPSPPPPQSRRPETTGPGYSDRPPPPLPGTRPPLAQSEPATPFRNDDRPPLPLKPTVASPLSPVASTVATPTPPPPLDDRIQSPGAMLLPTLALRPPPPLPPSDSELPQYRQHQIPPRYAAYVRPASNAPSPVSSSTANAGWSPNTPIDSTHVPRYSSPAPLSPHALLTSTLPGTSAMHASARPPPPPVPTPTSPPRLGQSQPRPPPPPLPPPFLSPQSTGVPYAIGHYTPVPRAHPSQLLNAGSPLPAPAPRPPPSIPPPDLLDAQDDSISSTTTFTQTAAPPRPPNPELVRLHDQVHAKLSSELASLTQAMALDGERLRAHQNDLLAGEPAIRDEMARLEAVRDVCRGVAARVGAVVQDAERNVAELKRKGDPDVDELVCSTTIVHNQLINLVAEDNAIEDTIYHLHRALNTGRIELERFLRTTRALAEEQFMKRALAEKILAGIPMRESGLSMRPEWS